MLSVLVGLGAARTSGATIIGLNIANLCAFSSCNSWKGSLLKSASLFDIMAPTGDLQLAISMMELTSYTQLGLMGSGAYWLYKRLDDKNLKNSSKQ